MLREAPPAAGPTGTAGRARATQELHGAVRNVGVATAWMVSEVRRSFGHDRRSRDPWPGGLVCHPVARLLRLSGSGYPPL